MKTSRSTAIKNGTAKAASLILGDAHFIFKSLADGCVLLEANIVHKLTDKPKDHIIEDRHNATESKQEYIKNLLKTFKDQMYEEHSDTMDVLTNMDN